MKPIPILTLTDYQLLRQLAKKSINSANAKVISQLTEELDRAIINKDGSIAENIIRIGSNVIIEDVDAKVQRKIQIVLPSSTDIKENKISVLAPLSVAVIGFKENDQIDWELPAGVRTFKIISVTNTFSGN